MANMAEAPERRPSLIPARADGWTALSTLSTVVVVIALFLFFGLTSERFFLPQNLLNILKQMSIVGILGIGMTVVILVGGIDLSVGSVVLLSSAVTALLLDSYDVAPVPAIGAGLVIGALVGLVNGVLVEVAGISPVIATLGTLIAVRGLGQILIENTYIWVTDPLFVDIASDTIAFLPIMAVIMLVLYVVFAIVLKQTVFGRYVYAIGGNPIAARLSGVPLLRVKILAYVLSGLLAAVAGMLTAATVGVVGPNAGAGMEFNAIAAVVLGGARLSGGVGRVEKTLLGTAIFTMVLNYLTLSGVTAIWQQTVTGFLVLGAVLLERFVQRGK